MISCKKPVWKVTFKRFNEPEVTESVLADNLAEVLSFYNEKWKENIVKIEKTREEATYHY